MFGRDRGPQAALKFFIYTFLPSALFLVAILWLYAKTGSFDYVIIRRAVASGSLGATPEALSWAALAFLVAFAVKVPVFPSTAGSAMSSAKPRPHSPWSLPASWASIRSCASISGSSPPRPNNSLHG